MKATPVKEEVRAIVEHFSREMFPWLYESLLAQDLREASKWISVLEEISLSHLCQAKNVKFRPTDLPYGDYGLIRDPAYKYSQEREKAFLNEDILAFLTAYSFAQEEFEEILFDKIDEKRKETLRFTFDVLHKEIKKQKLAPVY
jgi:hypothetical protein